MNSSFTGRSELVEARAPSCFGAYRATLLASYRAALLARRAFRDPTNPALPRAIKAQRRREVQDSMMILRRMVVVVAAAAALQPSRPRAVARAASRSRGAAELLRHLGDDAGRNGHGVVHELP